MKSKSSRSVAVGARIEEDLDADLARLAEATGRSKSWLIAEALRSYVANERQFIEAVREGQADYQAGRVVDHAAVVKELRKRRSRR
jgi:predicted transcriptional regulator